MARLRAPTALPAAERDGWAGARDAVLRTVPGRLIVIGLAVRLLIVALRTVTGPLPALFGVVDTAAGLAIAIGAVYFAYRLLAAAKRRLLWRVRRRLIFSYIFIGFIPSLLIVSFFLLGGFLLFYNLSSYLLASRLHALGDEARFLARTTALEIERAGGGDATLIVSGRYAGLAPQYPGASIAVVPVSRACAAAAARPEAAEVAAAATTAGPWAHVDPPQTLPAWIDCAGFGGLLAYVRPGTGGEDARMLVRGVAFPDAPAPRYGVVVDLPVNAQVRQRLRDETGVELEQVSLESEPDGAGVKALPGRAGAQAPDTGARAAAASAPLKSVSLLEYRDWATGTPGLLGASVRLSIGDIYDRVASATGQNGGKSVGQSLLVVLLEVVGGLFLVIEVVALAVGLLLAKSITGSVHALFAGTERVRQGDFTHKIAVKTDDQLGELAHSFNSMTSSIEDLLLQANEKKRLEEELRIAREIQMSLLPQGPLRMPGLSVTALCVPAREVGGDYYDFFPIDDHRLGVLIADVSGKGTSAALYMAELKGLMLSLSQIHTSPRGLLIVANGIIGANLDARSFITMTYAVVDLRARTMTYARAGHTPLMYLPGPPGAGPRHVQVLAPEGLVLGLKIDGGEMFERLLEESTIALGPGDLFLFFTDGLSEAMNEGDDCFGEGRLGDLIEEHGHLPSSELRERMLREVEAFVGAAPQHDDMTMVLLRIDEHAAIAATTVNAEIAELAELS